MYKRRRKRVIKRRKPTLKKADWKGKPFPIKGRGWCGYYNNWYFRSKLELSYMVNVIEKENLPWESGEDDKYRILYYSGKFMKRYYYPDFVLEGKRIIEIKPKSFHQMKNVRMKKEAALKFCKENGFTYEMIDPPLLSDMQMVALYLSKKIIFSKETEKKFLKKYIK